MNTYKIGDVTISHTEQPNQYGKHSAGWLRTVDGKQHGYLKEVDAFTPELEAEFLQEANKVSA